MLCLSVVAGVLYVNFVNGNIHSDNNNTGMNDSTIPDTDDEPVRDPVGEPEDDPVADPVDPDEIFSALTEISASSLLYGALVRDIVLGDEDGVGAIVPASVKIADGAEALALSVKNTKAGSEITLGAGEVAKSLDVHIDGIAEDNAVPMLVNLGAVLESGISDTALKLYHIENGAAVLMTRVNSADDFAIHNQYTYNAETGEISIYVASFSVFSAVQTTTDEWDGTSDTSWYNENDTEFTLTSAEQLAGFRDLVDGGNTFAGKTVTLGTDIDLANKPFDPIGFGYYNAETNTRVFMGTFDGAGHTIYNLYENCWELDPDKTNYSTYTYSTAGAGLFASIKDATIKNLAVSGAEIVFECVDMGVIVGYAQGTCHFENIVVTNSKIANYNRYTGGVVGEVSYGPYGIDTTKGYSHTFKNVTVDSSVTVSGLWGSFGCGMGGVIGGKWGDATVKMENVISAPVMDVYNDVVSAYQWYAFRGCGMLIGHTEEPYSDGRHSGNATASFLTCENVKVYYGDWVNYHYYEFENQDNATGRNYPWVRAEAGEYCDAFSNIRYGVPTHDGVKVSDLTEEELKAIATDYTPITFNQLYGADRGMYGLAVHPGVTVYTKQTLTIYVENTHNWNGLSIYYWAKNGEDRWSNLIDPEAMTFVQDNIYSFNLPAYADGFIIYGSDDCQVSGEYLVADYTDGRYSTPFEAYDLTSASAAEAVAGSGKWFYNCNDQSSSIAHELAATPSYVNGVITYAFNKMGDASNAIYRLRYQPTLAVGSQYRIAFEITVDAPCTIIYGTDGRSYEFAAAGNRSFVWAGAVDSTTPFYIAVRSTDRSAPITMTVSNIAIEGPINDGYYLASATNADTLANPGKWAYHCDSDVASAPVYQNGVITLAFDQMSDRNDLINQIRYQPDFYAGTGVKLTCTVNVTAPCTITYGNTDNKAVYVFNAAGAYSLEWIGTVNSNYPFSIGIVSTNRGEPVTMTVSDIQCEKYVANGYYLESASNADVVANPGVWYYFSEGATLAAYPVYDNGVLTFALKSIYTNTEVNQLRYQPELATNTKYTITFQLTVDAPCTIEYGANTEKQKVEIAEAGTQTITWTGKVYSGDYPFAINILSTNRSEPITMTVSNIVITEVAA